MAKKKKVENKTDQPDVIEGQPCPMCSQNKLVLAEKETEIPYFGKVYVFSMTCHNCKYHKADLECAEHHEPAKYTLEVSSEEDLKIRIVKSAHAFVKIPHVLTIEPGPASNGFVTNVEGIINRAKFAIESARESEVDKTAKKKAKKLIKKLNNVLWGRDKLKIIIEDKTGNSAIISDKVVKNKLRV